MCNQYEIKLNLSQTYQMVDSVHTHTRTRLSPTINPLTNIINKQLVMGYTVANRTRDTYMVIEKHILKVCH